MTAALGLLERLTAAGVTLDLDDGDILYRGPSATLTTEVLEELASSKSDVVIELQRWSAQEPCCPADIFERAACLIEGAGFIADEADARALDEHGFSSWWMLANAHRVFVMAQIRSSAGSGRPVVEGLATATRAFMGTQHWQDAIRAGWTMTELFGVSPFAPLVRVDAYGLVSGLVLSKLPGGRTVSIEGHGAVIRYPSGSELTFYRGKAALDHAVPWWACGALVACHDEASMPRRTVVQHDDERMLG